MKGKPPQVGRKTEKKNKVRTNKNRIKNMTSHRSKPKANEKRA